MDSRAKFEAWVSRRVVVKKYGAKLTRQSDGSYADYRINDRWLAWSAALAAATPAQQDAPTDAEVIEYLRELGDSIYVVIDGERAFLDKLKFARALLARFATAQDAERERDYTRQLETALLDCAKVAILRGDVYLCDCIDNTGRRYQSQFLADLFARAQRAAAQEDGDGND